MTRMKPGRGRQPPAKRRAAKPKAKPKLDGLSQEEVAHAVGCHQTTVSRAIARGDVTPLANGRLPESAIEILKSARSDEEDAREEVRDLNRRLLTAQTAEREAKAALRELELERQRGDFVSLARVKRDAEDCGERVVSTLRSVPQRVALALECPCRRAAVVEKVVSGEVERVIAQLHDSAFIPGPLEGAWASAGACALLAALAWMWTR